jgi:hypothetical protein
MFTQENRRQGEHVESPASMTGIILIDWLIMTMIMILWRWWWWWSIPPFMFLFFVRHDVQIYFFCDVDGFTLIRGMYHFILHGLHMLSVLYFFLIVFVFGVYSVPDIFFRQNFWLPSLPLHCLHVRMHWKRIVKSDVSEKAYVLSDHMPRFGQTILCDNQFDAVYWFNVLILERPVVIVQPGVGMGTLICFTNGYKWCLKRKQ